MDPDITEKLLTVSNKLTELDFLLPFKEKLLSAVVNINLELKLLRQSLNGRSDKSVTGKYYIPVVEETNRDSSLKLGLLESISVNLKKTKDKSKFIIVPSGKELESKLFNQIKTSWNIALGESIHYLNRKKLVELDVIISFDKRYGYYTGNSLGTALSLLFLEEILKFYNSPIIIDKMNVTAITGGIDENGYVLSVSKDIIKQKTKVVFYSEVNLFVIPKQDETASLNEIVYYQKKYPERKLKIESIENFDDLLNRRNIVEIKKQKIVVRSAKYVTKHWASSLLLLVVIFLVYVGRFYDFDTNPAILVNEGYWLSVQNKNGKELWKKRMAFSSYVEFESSLSKVAQKIIDVDDDGENEIIIARDDRNQYNPPKKPGRIACYSSGGEEIWEYYFRDTITSIEMIHSNYYVTQIIDTITINGTRAIACFANNILYPTAVYFLNIKTGKRIGKTMSHVGHLNSGIFKDLNQDGKLELIMTGLNNSLGRVVIFSIDTDKISGQLPAIGDRMFKEMPIADVNNYILLPKTDYTSYFDLKFNMSAWGIVNSTFRGNNPHIYLYEGKRNNYKGIMVEFNKDLTVKTIDISESLEVARDALVESGELQQPLSHTKEYLNILFNQIRHWDGEKFVTKEEYESSTKIHLHTSK